MGRHGPPGQLVTQHAPDSVPGMPRVLWARTHAKPLPPSRVGKGAGGLGLSYRPTENGPGG